MVKFELNQQVEDVMEDTLALVKKLYNNEGWVDSYVQNEVKIQVMPDPITGVYLTRGEGFIPHSQEQIHKLLEQVELRPEYDNKCASGYTVKVLNEKSRIFYQQFKGAFLVQGRDLVVLQKTFIEGDIWYAVGKSIEVSELPPQQGLVRADLKVGAWILEKQGNGTNCIYITWADAKGSLPKSAVNMVRAQQGELVWRLKNYLNKV
ncbi:hypothetical protein pb186bvf_020963 [Paramecium bursaria]